MPTDGAVTLHWTRSLFFLLGNQRNKLRLIETKSVTKTAGPTPCQHQDPCLPRPQFFQPQGQPGEEPGANLGTRFPHCNTPSHSPLTHTTWISRLGVSPRRFSGWQGTTAPNSKLAKENKQTKKLVSPFLLILMCVMVIRTYVQHLTMTELFVVFCVITDAARDR